MHNANKEINESMCGTIDASQCSPLSARLMVVVTITHKWDSIMLMFISTELQPPLLVIYEFKEMYADSSYLSLTLLVWPFVGIGLEGYATVFTRSN